MAGWFKLRGVETGKYKVNATPDPDEAWPPKYWKFALETVETPRSEAAFVDSRRFARIRLIDCPAEEMRNTSPLKENGPDPVIDQDILTEEWLRDKLKSKKIPVKALLLDQANISGVGNWVGDEILYDAQIHPEQYSNTLSPAQISRLYTSLHDVCSLAVSTLADSSKFPETWLFKHRWGKGKKDSPNQLPNGAKIVFLTVGGRTSAVVPSVQKKTGPVAGDVKDEGNGEAGEVEKLKKGKKRVAPKKAAKGIAKAETASEHEVDDEEEEEIDEPKPKRGRKRAAPVPAPTKPSKLEDANDHDLLEHPKKRSSRSSQNQPPAPNPSAEISNSKKQRANPSARNGLNIATDSNDEDEEEEDPAPAPNKRQKTKTKPATAQATTKKKEKPAVARKRENGDRDGDATSGRRRSKRVGA
ncbi:MAG: hypothetical protein Q9187_007918 [Circinaria calcarea]